MMRHRSLQGLERMGPGYAIDAQMMIGLKGAQGVLGLGPPKTIDSEGMVIAVVITERMQIALQMPELVMRHGAMGDMQVKRRFVFWDGMCVRERSMPLRHSMRCATQIFPCLKGR